MVEPRDGMSCASAQTHGHEHGAAAHEHVHGAAAQHEHEHGHIGLHKSHIKSGKGFGNRGSAKLQRRQVT